MVKILHISRTMGQGGAEKIVFQLSVGLNDIFEKVFVASTGGELVSKLEERGIFHTDVLDLENKSIPILYSNILNLLNLVLSENIDIIHCHHRMALFYAKILKIWRPKVKLIYTAHNIFSDKKIIYRFLLKNVKVISVGSSVTSELLNNLRLKSSSVIEILNAVLPTTQLTEVPSEYIGSHRTKILCIARLSEQKGLDFLIKSFATFLELYPNKAELFIIGDGTLRDTLEMLVYQLDCVEYVHFLGYKRNVDAYIKNCDFMVLTSRWEGFPLTPIECFMNGKTIIATNIAGTIDIVNGKNGTLIEYGDTDNFVIQVNSLIDDISLRKSKESEAFKTYLNSFSYDTFLEKYKLVYRGEQ